MEEVAKPTEGRSLTSYHVHTPPSLDIEPAFKSYHHNSCVTDLLILRQARYFLKFGRYDSRISLRQSSKLPYQVYDHLAYMSTEERILQAIYQPYQSFKNNLVGDLRLTGLRPATVVEFSSSFS